MTAKRTVAGRALHAIGLGAMNITHGYQPGLEDAAAERFLNRALDLGVDHLDTAAVYGSGRSETLIGRFVSHRRGAYHLATKCGFNRDAEGAQFIDNTPETIRRSCEESLARLQTDVIDLFYLHRWDKKTPIEDVVGAMARLVEEGKVHALGLSEVSAATLRAAHAAHPIAALQSEYSLWTRNPEIAALDACREIGATFVAFSPVGRQFLTGAFQGVEACLDGDMRRRMPRFAAEAYPANKALLVEYAAIAEIVGCSMAQLALAWGLAKGDHVFPIPGTQNLDHLEENHAAADVTLSPEIVTRLDRLINQETVVGPRYPDAMQATVDTEEFAAV